MSLDVHRRAELLMGQADLASTQGRSGEAAALYRDAAEEETRAFDLIPVDRARTRGIIAVSSVALFRKAGAVEEGIHQAYLLLARQDLPDFAKREIEALVDDLRAERGANVRGRTYGLQRFEWVLQGPGIGPGLARLHTVAQAIDHAEKYGIRVFELLAKVPIRKAGPVDPAVRQAFDMELGALSAGSFRFEIRFSTPMQQLPLFESHHPVAAQQIGAAFGAIIAAAASPDADLLTSVVDDPEYRDAFLRLTRSMAPDGKEMSQIEVSGESGGVMHTAVLTPEVGRQITRYLVTARPRRAKQLELLDTLRGVNLNDRFILLGEKPNERKCYVPDGMVLVDVIDGLMDRRVKATVRRDRRKLVLDDVVEAPDEPEDNSPEAANGKGHLPRDE